MRKLRVPPGRERRSLRLAFFGAFYPAVHNLATTSNGLVQSLLSSPRISGLRVFCQEGGRTPPNWSESKLTVSPAFADDDPVSLLRGLGRLVADRGEVDVYFFNLHLTGFGRSRIANAVGLMIPVGVSLASRRPTFVYMHNLIETEDVSRLGYSVSRPTRFIVRLIEKLIQKTTHLIVPLPSQSAKAERSIGSPIGQFVLPYAEGLLGLAQVSSLADAPVQSASALTGIPNVLLFGAWGPQKDLLGAIAALEQVVSAGRAIHVQIAGPINMHFPDYAAQIRELEDRLPHDRFEFLGECPEEQIGQLFSTADLVVLPYNATGGYSAVMNVAAAFGCRMIAYDLPTLREFANEIKTDVTFIKPGDLRAFASAVEELLTDVGRARDKAVVQPGERVLVARAAGERLIDAFLKAG